MNFFKRFVDSGRHKVHEIVKWLLSGLSAVITLGFILVLETA